MPYNILALDGGGTWAVIEAKTLQKLFPEAKDGHDVLSQFDMVAANSGGSIVIAGLINNYSPERIVRMFNHESERNKIFSRLPFYKRLNPLHLFNIGPRFSTDDKLKGLREVLPVAAGIKLRDLDIRSNTGDVIPFLFISYDYDRDRARILRSGRPGPSANFPQDPERMTVVEAVHASTNAPVNFFDKPAVIDGRRYWDGAVAGYNNPVFAAVLEAISRGVPREDIRVLSLGTGNVVLPVCPLPESPDLVKQPDPSGILNNVRKLSEAIISDPPDAHTFAAHVVLGGRLPRDTAHCPLEETPVIRMNPLIQPVIKGGQWSYPEGLSPGDFITLVDMDMAAIDPDDVALINLFCDLWLDDKIPNQPVRASGSVFYNPHPKNVALCEIGHPVFSSAAAAWKRHANTHVQDHTVFTISLGGIP